MAGLLFFIAAALAVLFGLFGEQISKREYRAAGALLLEDPQLEKEIIGAFWKKENRADKEERQRAGEALAQKYGYSAKTQEELFLPYIMAGGAILLAGAFGLFLVWRRLFISAAGDREETQRTREALTELESRFEQAMVRLEKEENDTKILISDISHQLKTPIASLKLGYEIIQTTALEEEEREELVQKEYEDLKKLEALLESLMNLSKLEARLIQIQPVEASLRATLTNAVNSVYMKALEKQIDISMEPFEDIRLVHDPKWTAEVFVNILDNAVKYSDRGSHVCILVEEMVSYALVRVQDEGIGIPPEERNQIFKRFYRGKSDRILCTEGSGIGLYLARRIIEEQGGAVSVKDGMEGGSEFCVLLRKK
ncbi:MAG: HAMP domain-containing sensor histidine kinase [Eubacteriales bacterium]|nr:HAMP domain-containing sensor histidine kinase [Eubacteriales bacterium]